MIKKIPSSGGGTPQQWITYMILGSAFWLGIVLITNYIGLAKLSAHVTFQSTTCNRNLKICLQRQIFYDLCVKAFDDCRGSKNFVFPEHNLIMQEKPMKKPQVDTHNYTKLEQITNRKRCKSYDYFDLKICESLCPYRGKGVSECNVLCRSLVTSKTGMYGLICPGDKLCPNGCPCPHYRCETVSSSSMWQVGWYYGHLTDYFDPAGIANVLGLMYEPSSITSMRIDDSILALYDYRTGEKILFDKVKIGRPNGANNPYSGFWFGGIEYDDFNPYGGEQKENEQIYVISSETAAAVFYEDEHYLVTYGLRVFKLPFSGIIEDMNFQLHYVRNRKIEFHKGGVTAAYKNRLYFCQLVVERDICFSTPFKKNEIILQNKGSLKNS